MGFRYRTEETSSTDYYSQVFSRALKPNTLIKANEAAERARKKHGLIEHVVLDGFAEDENRNLDSEHSWRRNFKRINPQPPEEEESLELNVRPSTSQENGTCSLTLANKKSQECLQCLTEVCFGLSDLSEANELKKSKQFKEKNIEATGIPSSPFIVMAENMVKSSKDSFVVAYKLNETTIGFHVTEDFLRDPQKVSLLDFSARGRIRIPTKRYNDKSFTNIAQVVTDCLAAVDTFEENHPKEKTMITLLNVFATGMKHFETAAEYCKDVFESLLYVCGEGVEALQQFISTLNSFERSDIIMEVQSLRRKIDEITIALEKLSWKSHLILQRAKGFIKSTTSVPSTKIKSKVLKHQNSKSNATGTTKKKKLKTKVKRKKSVAAQFIKNQEGLQNEETSEIPIDSEEC